MWYKKINYKVNKKLKGKITILWFKITNVFSLKIIEK